MNGSVPGRLDDGYANVLPASAGLVDPIAVHPPTPDVLDIVEEDIDVRGSHQRKASQVGKQVRLHQCEVHIRSGIPKDGKHPGRVV
jgi:hypothetical protein